MTRRRLCDQHRAIIAVYEKAQREDKRLRDKLNRNPGVGKNPILKRLNQDIRARRCDFLNLRASYTETEKVQCYVCSRNQLFRAIHLPELFPIRLRSSMVERPACSGEVVGSTPAVGSTSQ